MSLFALKPGVSIKGLQPETLLGIFLVKQVYESFGLDFVVTSVVEGAHKVGSLHYKGLAFDGRISNIQDPGMISKIVEKCKYYLGPQWDVILEMEKVHIHFEFDPKS